MRNDMAMRAERAWQAEREALRAEIARLRRLLDAPPPLPELRFYGNDVAEVVAAIQRRGIHPHEFEWVARYIQQLADYETRLGDE